VNPVAVTSIRPLQISNWKLTTISIWYMPCCQISIYFNIM